MSENLSPSTSPSLRSKPRAPRAAKKNLDDLIRQTAQDEVAKNTIIPPLTPDEALEIKAQEVTQRMNQTTMQAAEIYYQIYTEKLWERRGFADMQDYFNDRIGIAYRTAMRAIQIWEAHLAIPEETRADARRALEQIGVHRAAIIAPAIKESPLTWTEWTKAAAEISQEALQEKVSKTRGLPPKQGTDGDRLYNTFVSRLDKDEREEFEQTYKALSRITESKDFVVNVAIAFREGKTAWLAAVERINKGQGNA